MLHVDKNRVVALRYVMRNAKGEVLEDTMQAAPVNYLHGSEGILPLLQEQLKDLKAGDKKNVYLFNTTGGADDDFEFSVVIDDVREALDEEIALGYPVNIATAVCADDCYCYEEKQRDITKT